MVFFGDILHVRIGNGSLELGILVFNFGFYEAPDSFVWTFDVKLAEDNQSEPYFTDASIF
jgi:hypothetical protein